MSAYKTILAAVDLSEESVIVREKARTLATQFAAELHMVHVVEPIVVGYAFEVMSVDVAGLQAKAEQHAREALNKSGQRIGVPPGRLHTVVGQPAREIRVLAEQLGADLIVMGGHGKHGFELLLGATSSAVTHGVGCDLLIVHLPKK